MNNILSIRDVGLEFPLNHFLEIFAKPFGLGDFGEHLTQDLLAVAAGSTLWKDGPGHYYFWGLEGRFLLLHLRQRFYLGLQVALELIEVIDGALQLRVDSQIAVELLVKVGIVFPFDSHQLFLHPFIIKTK